MKAGSLTERICLLSLHEIKDETGSVTKDYRHAHTIRAERRRMATLPGKGVNAMEEFTGNSIVFCTWMYSFLKETMRVKYNCNTYSISMIERQADNKSCLIYCNKINE